MFGCGLVGGVFVCCCGGLVGVWCVCLWLGCGCGCWCGWAGVCFVVSDAHVSWFLSCFWLLSFVCLVDDAAWGGWWCFGVCCFGWWAACVVVFGGCVFLGSCVFLGCCFVLLVCVFVCVCVWWGVCVLVSVGVCGCLGGGCVVGGGVVPVWLGVVVVGGGVGVLFVCERGVVVCGCLRGVGWCLVFCGCGIGVVCPLVSVWVVSCECACLCEVCGWVGDVEGVAFAQELFGLVCGDDAAADGRPLSRVFAACGDGEELGGELWCGYGLRRVFAVWAGVAECGVLGGGSDGVGASVGFE